MAGGDGAEDVNLEFTPTWAVAVVCSVIVFISLCVERFLHFLGKLLKKKKNQRSLYEALLKVKEELMLLGFISLLLTVFQGALQSICVPQSYYNHLLPCKKNEDHVSTSEHYQSAFAKGILGSGRRLLSSGGSEKCTAKGKIPLLSLEAIHQLHIFIFVLAITHVTFCVTTMILGSLRIRQWEAWEDSIQKDNSQSDPKKVTHVHDHGFIQKRFKGIGKKSIVIRRLHSFGKQFYGSVTRLDYTTMRLGFIMTHCRGNPKFNFHKYMIRALEADFKKVVGISWHLWIFAVIFLLLNVNGWHTYFWIAFIPLILLLVVGTKLEHVITQLAHDVAERHTATEGDLIVKPSDEHFWFNEPRIILHLIHFILFQNAFEIAYFFWIWSSYGFGSCIMGQVGYIIPRLVIGLVVQILCSYSTLPLYAIVTQMGSKFKKAIFDESVQEALVGWAQNAKRKGHRAGNGLNRPSPTVPEQKSPEIVLQDMGVQTTPQNEEGSATSALLLHGSVGDSNV